MLRSLFAGVSGLRNHQVRMDVIGNNIANVNTVAFKASRVTFEDAFSQVVQAASRPSPSGSGSVGGISPMQVGLGMAVGSIDQLFTQGNLETTGRTTDLAIQGESFFVVSDGAQNFYTRSGNFQFDSEGRLVSAMSGLAVQGRSAVNGEFTAGIGDIRLPFGQKSPAQATTSVTVAGNLDASAAEGTTREGTITVFDSKGNKHDLKVVFTRAAADAPDPWTFAVQVNGEDVAVGDNSLGFAANGTLSEDSNQTITWDPGNGADTMEVELNFGAAGDMSSLTSAASPSTAVLREQNGYTMGDLERISIDQFGVVSGSFTNGTVQPLAQIALADFNNPAGLVRTGDNAYSVSANSGVPIVGFSGAGSNSMITSGALEMSNVDLAQEFTSMIAAQRGFQSNARVIATSDEMLQELVNLKR